MRENNFVGFEYTEITIKQFVSTLCVDGYVNFGWELERTSYPASKPDSVELKFKRDRKNRKNTKLAQLQQKFEECLTEVSKLEASKNNVATLYAMVVGIIGTAFMTGAVFAIVSNMIPLGVVLAVPAFIGWGLPYFIYKKMLKQQTAKITPTLDQKYDEIYAVCENANTLLHAV